MDQNIIIFLKLTCKSRAINL